MASALRWRRWFDRVRVKGRARVYVFLLSISHADRVQARAHLLTLPNGHDLARYERARRMAEGEPEEPLEQP